MNVLKTALTLLGIVAFATVVLLILMFPLAPTSPTGWILLIVAGIPAWLLLEAFGEAAFSREMGESFSDKKFSGVRVLYALGIMLLLLALLFSLWSVVEPYVSPHFGTWFG